MIGPLALLLNISQIGFQDEYVAKFVSRFPAEDATKENESFDTDLGNKECKDDNDVGGTQSESEQNATKENESIELDAGNKDDDNVGRAQSGT